MKGIGKPTKQKTMISVEYIKLNPEMHHFDKWVTCVDSNLLKIVFETNLVKSNFKIVNFIEHYFTNQGYTCVWLLAESHLAIHTFPENNKSYIQISSCNKHKLDDLIKHLDKIPDFRSEKNIDI